MAIRRLLLLMVLLLSLAACGGGDDDEGEINDAETPVQGDFSGTETFGTSGELELTDEIELTDEVEMTDEANLGAGTQDDASAAVEAYLLAKVAGDRDGVAEYLCADLEPMLDAESLSFSGVTAEINGMTCTHEEGSDTVICAGQIDADYGGEARTFELGTYRVVEEDGTWKWCGETQ